MRYILDAAGNPVPEPDLFKWAQWFENGRNRILEQDHAGGFFVSTVFLALDHNFAGGPPILWETMIFPETKTQLDVPYAHFQNRYSSREEAIEGHRRIVQMLTSYSR